MILARVNIAYSKLVDAKLNNFYSSGSFCQERSHNQLNENTVGSFLQIALLIVLIHLCTYLCMLHSTGTNNLRDSRRVSFTAFKE